MNFLKEKREEKKYSQMQLAYLSGVSVRMIQKYEIKERDIKKASAITVFNIAKVLNISVEELLNNM